MDFSKMCPKYELAIDLLGKKWTGLIVRVLLDGPKRFKDIKAQIPDISDRILTERMRELETLGLVKRNVYPEIPVRIEYVLTSMGDEMKNVIESIQNWSEKWM
jgi:DNA-binding HxlR family transcriptional regulator